MVCEKLSILIHIIVLQVKLIFHSNINELTKFLLLDLENLKFILVPKVLKTLYLICWILLLFLNINWLIKTINNVSQDNKVQHYKQSVSIIESSFSILVYAICNKYFYNFVQFYKLMFCLLNSDTLQELLFVFPSF